MKWIMPLWTFKQTNRINSITINRKHYSQLCLKNRTRTLKSTIHPSLWTWLSNSNKSSRQIREREPANQQEIQSVDQRNKRSHLKTIENWVFLQKSCMNKSEYIKKAWIMNFVLFGMNIKYWHVIKSTKCYKFINLNKNYFLLKLKIIN